MWCFRDASLPPIGGRAAQAAAAAAVGMRWLGCCCHGSQLMGLLKARLAFSLQLQNDYWCVETALPGSH